MPAQSKKIFIDSSAFIAFIDRASENHYRVIDIFQKLASDRFHVFTSNLVLAETYDRLLGDLGSSTAREFLSTIFEGDIDILESSKADIPSALKLLNYYSNRDIVVLEALNAILMNKRGIPQVLSFSYWNSLLGTEVFVLPTE